MMALYDDNDNDSAGAVGGRVINSCVKRLVESVAPLGIDVDIPRGLPAKLRLQKCIDAIVSELEKRTDEEIEVIAQKADTLQDLTPRQILNVMTEAVEEIRIKNPDDRVVILVWDFLKIVMKGLGALTVVPKKVTENNFEYMSRYIDDLLEMDEKICRFGNGKYRETAKLAIYP